METEYTIPLSMLLLIIFGSVTAGWLCQCLWYGLIALKRMAGKGLLSLFAGKSGISGGHAVSRYRNER